MGKHYKETNKKALVLSILRILFFIALIISIIYIIKWNKDSEDNKKVEEKISEAITIENTENEQGEEEKKYKVDFEKLKEINDETVAWLKVNRN